MIYFTAPGPASTARGLNVTDLKITMQRAQLIKSQIPDPEFPADTFTFTMHVDKVRNIW